MKGSITQEENREAFHGVEILWGMESSGSDVAECSRQDAKGLPVTVREMGLCMKFKAPGRVVQSAEKTLALR